MAPLSSPTHVPQASQGPLEGIAFVAESSLVAEASVAGASQDSMSVPPLLSVRVQGGGRVCVYWCASFLFVCVYFCCAIIRVWVSSVPANMFFLLFALFLRRVSVCVCLLPVQVVGQDALELLPSPAARTSSWVTYVVDDVNDNPVMLAALRLVDTMQVCVRAWRWVFVCVCLCACVVSVRVCVCCLCADLFVCVCLSLCVFVCARTRARVRVCRFSKGCCLLMVSPGYYLHPSLIQTKFGAEWGADWGEGEEGVTAIQPCGNPMPAWMESLVLQLRCTDASVNSRLFVLKVCVCVRSCVCVSASRACVCA